MTPGAIFLTPNNSKNNPAQPCPIPASVIENQQIFAAFENSVAHRVNQQLEQKLARRQSLYIGIAALVVTLITASGSFFFNRLIATEVNAEVEAQLTSESEQLQTAEFLPRVITLEIQLRAFDEDIGVNPTEVDRAINEFTDLYATYVTPLLLSQDSSNGASTDQQGDLQTLRLREAQLMNAFNLLMRITRAMGDTEEAGRIAETTPRLAADSEIAVQALAQSYGRQLIGAPGAPTSWMEGEAFHETFQHYRDWSQRALNNNFPEIFYLYEGLIWHVQGRDDSEIQQILDSVDGLNELDGDHYEGLLEQLATEGFVLEPTAASTRAAARARAFVEAYAGSSQRVQNVARMIGQ